MNDDGVEGDKGYSTVWTAGESCKNARFGIFLDEPAAFVGKRGSDLLLFGSEFSFVSLPRVLPLSNSVF